MNGLTTYKSLLLDVAEGFVQGGFMGVAKSIFAKGIQALRTALDDEKKRNEAFAFAYGKLPTEQKKEAYGRLSAFVKGLGATTGGDFMEKLLAALVEQPDANDGQNPLQKRKANFQSEYRANAFLERLAKDDDDFRALLDEMKSEMRKKHILEHGAIAFKAFKQDWHYRYLLFALEGKVPSENDCRLIFMAIAEKFTRYDTTQLEQVVPLSVFANTLLVLFEIVEDEDALDYEDVVNVKDFMSELMKGHFSAEVTDVFIYEDGYWESDDA